MYIIIGGSSGVGRALAVEFASKGCDLLLVSREDRDTQAIASDLMLRFNVSINVVKLDLSSNQPNFEKILEKVDLAGRSFKGMLMPAGTVIDRDVLEIEIDSTEVLFRVNCLSIICLVTEVLKRSHEDCELNIVGFGSIASVRARSTNMVYSTAKTALMFYFGSLRHACVKRKTTVQFYVLGYMDTNLAFAYDVPLPKGNPNKLAQIVYRNTNKDIGVKFYPRYWFIVGVILKLIPWPVFKHLKI